MRALFIALSLLPIAGHAEDIYKCDGVYTNVPCRGDKRVMDRNANTVPPPAPRADAYSPPQGMPGYSVLGPQEEPTTHLYTIGTRHGQITTPYPVDYSTSSNGGVTVNGVTFRRKQ